jgi:hypothetical protein
VKEYENDYEQLLEMLASFKVQSQSKAAI